MPRPLPVPLALTLGALAMAGCGGDTTPTAPDTSGDPTPVASLSALARNTWTAKAPLPSIPGFGMYGGAAGVVPNSAGQSILYVLGGTSFTEGGSGFPVQAYNVAANTWTTKAANVYSFQTNGVGKIGSRLYFSGGYNYSGGYPMTVTSLWAYDPATDRMIAKREMPLATAEGVTGVINGKLYVLPGICSGEFWPDPRYCDRPAIRKFFRYDPATNVWTKMAWCPHFHARGAGGVINGKFYVAGGSGGHYLDVYDPVTNTWKTLASGPAAGGIGAVLQGMLYVIWGTSTYAYNPLTNTWKTKGSTTWPHDAVAQVRLDGKGHLLAVGGANFEYPNASHDSELYTP